MEQMKEIAEKIENKCTEHFTTSGERFYGVSWHEVSEILESYGYKKEPPF